MKLSHSGLRLLKACVDNPTRQMYGYDLMQLTGLASGTLYPLLLRFEQEGWLASQWEAVDPATEGRPRRRLYRITNAGYTALSYQLHALGMGAAA